MVQLAADTASLFYAERESTSVGLQTVADFHDDLARIARAYVHHPLPALACELAGVQHRAFALLCSPRRVRDTRGLLVIAGLACGLLAHASMDLGNRTAAARQAQIAWLVAEEADHHPLMAWTAGTRSLVGHACRSSSLTGAPC